MSSATKEQKDGKAMATDLVAPGGTDDAGDDRPKGPPPAEKQAGSGGAGFFRIYKKGQGYWTRMGTAFGVAFLTGLTAWEIYRNRAYFGMAGNERQKIAFGVASGLFLLVAGLAWRLMNKPANVDFLIATDSEMKKVNWTSRKDLIGSTKVVVAFMFFIAFFLAVSDVLMAKFFEVIGVLRGGGHTLFGG
jgi:preprotein translocase SecE subunit